MSKKIASKRNKGKVDFKRKTTDSLMTDKNAGLGEGEEERIVLVMRKCKKSRDEVTLAQQKFLRRKPDGLLTKEEFIDEAKDQLLAQAVFKVFDKDGSGTMDFIEFMQAQRALSLNTIEEKLEWIFCIFDSDNGGTIEIDEIEDIVKNIFDFAGIRQSKVMLEACVTDVKCSVDKDNDGSITKEEFITNARRSKFIRNMFLTE